MFDSQNGNRLHPRTILANWMRRQAMVSELQALDDAILADIGLKRSDIDEAVDRSCPPISLHDAAAAVLNGLAEGFRNRAAARRLAVLDDHLLADMGISRCDIDLIAKSRYPRRPIPTQPTQAIRTAESLGAEACNDKHHRLAA